MKKDIYKYSCMGLVLALLLCTNAHASLVSLWDCDDAVGTTTLTDSVSGINGTLNGSMTFETSGVGAAYGNALWSPHRNNFVALADDGGAWDFGTGDFTISGWLRMDWLGSRHGNVFVNGGWNTGGFEMTLLKDAVLDGGPPVGNEGKLQFTVFGIGANQTYVVSDSVLADAQWHWFAGVVSGQSMDLFVDGVLQSGSGASYGAATTTTTIDAAYIDKNFAARVDDIAIFNTALAGTLSGNDLISGELYDVWQNPVVPEPTTLALLSMGGLIGLCKKKNK